MSVRDFSELWQSCLQISRTGQEAQSAFARLMVEVDQRRLAGMDEITNRWYTYQAFLAYEGKYGNNTFVTAPTV